MISFRREGPPVVWGEPYGDSAGPLTWRPIVPSPERPKAFVGDIALATCANGHECRMSADVHRVDADGTVHPSYVCPVTGCGFHDFVTFDGWSQTT